MKSNTKLALALAGVMALAAQTAGAAPTTDNTLYISGATAVDRTLFEAVLDQTNGVCDSTNPINVYSTATSGTTPSSFGNWLIHCTARDTATFGTGTEIGISKTSQGSEYGIDPVANGSTTLTVNGASVSVTSLTTTCTGGTATVGADATNTRLAYTFKHVRDEVQLMKKGGECGVTLAGFSDYQRGDVVQQMAEKRTRRLVKMPVFDLATLQLDQHAFGAGASGRTRGISGQSSSSSSSSSEASEAAKVPL